MRGNFKKNTIISIIFFIVSLSVLAVAFLYNKKLEKPIYYSESTLKNIANIYWVNKQLYYIKVGGQLYLKTDSGDKLVHTFPTYVIEWSEKLNAFLYYNKNAIFSYDISTNKVKKLIKMKDKHEERPSQFIYAVINKNVFLSIDSKNYKVDLDTSEIISLTNFSGTIAKDNNMIIYSAYRANYENCIMYFNLSTNSEYEIFHDDFLNKNNLSVLSSCVVDDIIYFVKTDGKIYTAKIKNGIATTEKILPENADILKMDVVDITWTGKNLLCLAKERGSYRGSIYVCEVNFDGTYNIIYESDRSDYWFGRYVIRTDGKKYAYIVPLVESVVYGQLNSNP